MVDEIWHRCTLALGGLTRVEHVRHRVALVGQIIAVDRARWEIISVEYPGKPYAMVRDEQAGLTRAA